MNDNEHPITPPPELVQQWMDLPLSEEERLRAAYRAGADQELEWCCKWLEAHFHGMKEWAAELRATRRPKPLSQADLALEALDAEDDAWPIRSLEKGQRFNTIRAALKRLKELEQANSQPS